jgi:hypothetical protein
MDNKDDHNYNGTPGQARTKNFSLVERCGREGAELEIIYNLCLTSRLLSKSGHKFNCNIAL